MTSLTARNTAKRTIWHPGALGLADACGSSGEGSRVRLSSAGRRAKSALNTLTYAGGVGGAGGEARRRVKYQMKPAAEATESTNASVVEC